MAKLPDFSDIFSKYEALQKSVDAIFQQIDDKNPNCVTCKEGCSDCCNALFDLSLVEAMYLNTKFQENMDYGAERSQILERADEVDRKVYKLKHKLFKESQEGRESNEIIAEVGKVRMRCPLLGSDDRCHLYAYRPLTCRLYGVPTNIGGVARSCGQSNFEAGKAYPAVSFDALTRRMSELSAEIVERCASPFTDLPGVFVPLSMALLNKYDAKYFGLEKDGAKK